MGDVQHVKFHLIAQTGSFQCFAEFTVEPRYSWEIMDARKANTLDVLQEHPHVAQHVNAIEAGDDRYLLDLGQHLSLSNSEDHFVGICHRKHAGQRSVSLHTEVAGVIDA